MRRILFVLLALLAIASVLVACGTPAAPATTDAPAAEAPAEEVAEAPAEEAAAEEAPAEEAAATEAPVEEPTATPIVDIPGKTTVRWFVGLGTGSNEAQQEAQLGVVEAFNAANPDLNLVIEFVTNESARDTLATQIASGAGPDVVGPVGWVGSNGFYGQWADMTPLIETAGYDLSQFSDELVSMMQTSDEGQVGLPFAVYPAALFYNPSLFDEAGLNYPPAAYGEPYVMPDGTEVEWTFDVLTQIAKNLTVDVNGESPLMLDDSDQFVASEAFDAAQIVQYGFTYNWSNQAYYTGTYWGAASDIAEDGSASIPEGWKEAWRWWYDAMYGDEPFYPNDAVAAGPDFASGNPFASGKVAMAITQSWYTCCLADAGEGWDLAALPTQNGVVNGRIDADTFRILKDSKNPDAAFRVVAYLVGDGSLPLLGVYGGLPSREEDLPAFIETLSGQYPHVENWDAFAAGLAYPDIPSAEAYRPNSNEVIDRYNTFGTVLRSTDDLDLDAEIELLEADLTQIFQRAQ